MSDAPAPTKAPSRKLVWIAATVLVLGLGWLFFNQQSCSRWREDVKTAQQNVFTGIQSGGDFGGFVQRLAALEDEEPPFCSPPEVEAPSLPE